MDSNDGGPGKASEGMGLGNISLRAQASPSGIGDVQGRTRTWARTRVSASGCSNASSTESKLGIDMRRKKRSLTSSSPLAGNLTGGLSSISSCCLYQ